MFVRSHIRQLIFIALHSSRPSLDGPKDRSVFESPRKFAAKQQKESYAVGPGAAAAAVQLLESFVTTNSPDALGRALPHYPSVKNTKSNDATEITDSTLAKQSLCIKEAKNCWDILVEGFTLGASQNCSSSKGKGKRRQEFIASEYFSEDPLSLAQVVGKDSWPLLNWLVDLFERDESLLEQRGQREQAKIWNPDISDWFQHDTHLFLWNSFPLPGVSRQLDGTRLPLSMSSSTVLSNRT